jgi:hypothetical protein
MNIDSHLIIIAYMKKLQCYIGDSFFPNIALLHFAVHGQVMQCYGLIYGKQLGAWQISSVQW